MQYQPWYAEYRREAFEELQEKTARLDRQFGMQAWSGLDHRLDGAVLTLADRTGARLRAEVQVVGVSHGADWTWAWAMGGQGSEPDADVDATLRFGLEYGVEELATPRLRADYGEDLGWALAAVVIRLTGALGAYRAFDIEGAPFLAIRAITSVAAEPANALTAAD